MEVFTLDILSLRLKALAVFRGLLADPVVDALLALLDSLEGGAAHMAVSAYGEFVSRLYQAGGDLGRYMLDAVETDENAYIRALGRGETPPGPMARCLETELETLQAAASLDCQDLRGKLKQAEFLPGFETSPVCLAENYRRRAADVGRYGWGIYAKRHMFCLDHTGRIAPVEHPDPIRLADLVDYKREQQAILDNTRALLAGRPAANVLLTGDAGTGKSSTIKAVANELAGEGLRIIELHKEQMREIPHLLDQLSDNPLKFILFIDDLSFQKGDDSYSALKAALEGSVSAKSINVAIYATSNRRHIVKERFSDREGDDVHRSDAMQEAVSLSERFGLQVTFQKPGKDGYLSIVRALARQQNIHCPDLDMLAERFALSRGGRSPRAARQFVDSLAAKTAAG